MREVQKKDEGGKEEGRTKGKRKEENKGERKKSSRFRLRLACFSQYRYTDIHLKRWRQQHNYLVSILVLWGYLQKGSLIKRLPR